MLIKHNFFFSVLVVFGKFFVFGKMSKISKTVLSCFSDSVAGWSSRMFQSRAHTEIFRGSLAGQCPSREKYLEYFFKIWVFNVSHNSDWRLVHGWRFQLWGVHRDFRSLPCDSLVGRTSSREKYLDKFFRICVLSVLVTDPGNLLATWLSRENCVFCTNRSVFKFFQFFPQTFMFVHCLPHINSLSNSPYHSHKPPFLLHFNFKSLRKRYGFSLSHYIFLVLRIIFLNLWVVFNIGFLGVSIIGWIIFVEFEWISLVVYVFKMLHFSVIIIVFLF